MKRRVRVYKPMAKGVSRYDNGGTPKQGDPPTANDSDLKFFTEMTNSPLFIERYARMVGKPLEEVTEEAGAYRKQILNNLNTVRVNPIGQELIRGQFEREGVSGLYFPGLPKEYIDGLSKRQLKQYKPVIDASHSIFLENDNPNILTHETSHATNKNDIYFANPFKFRDLTTPRSNSPLEEYFARKYNSGYTNSNPVGGSASRQEYIEKNTEIKARKDAVAKWMMEQGLYDPTKENFTEVHYKRLRNALYDIDNKEDESIPYQQMMDIYHPFKKEETIRMFNDIVRRDDTSDDTQMAKYGGFFSNGGSNPPASHYKRLYSHDDKYIPNGLIDPNTGYKYFPEESPVPEDLWNTSRFLYQPFIAGEKQGVHNATYDKSGEFKGVKELFTSGEPTRHRFKAAKEDISNYYEKDLGQTRGEARSSIMSKMQDIRKMHRAQNKMGDYYFTEFQNPDHIFDETLGTGYQMDPNDEYYKEPLAKGEAKRAYTKFQKAWRGTSGKEARENSRNELEEARIRNKIYKKEQEEYDTGKNITNELKLY